MRRFSLPVLSSFLVSSHFIAFLLFSSRPSLIPNHTFSCLFHFFESLISHLFLSMSSCVSSGLFSVSPLFSPLIVTSCSVSSLLLLFLVISCLSSSSSFLLLQGHSSYKCGPSIPQRDTTQHNATQIHKIQLI